MALLSVRGVSNNVFIFDLCTRKDQKTKRKKDNKNEIEKKKGEIVIHGYPPFGPFSSLLLIFPFPIACYPRALTITNS